jgi:anti-sigma factor RsiW
MMSSSGKQIYDDRLLTRYLLGVLPAEEAERLDELSVADEEFAWRLNGIENDLVDAYVRGELSGEDLQQFKAFYLTSPKRRHKVEFAEGLLALERKAAAQPMKTKPEKTPADPGQTEQTPGRFSWRMFAIPRFAFQWGFAGAALVTLVVAGYLLSENLRLRRQMTEAQAQHASVDRRAQIEQQLNRERSAKEEALKELEHARESQTNLDQLKTLSILLLPPTRGTSRVATITLRPGADLVVLVLALESDDFPAYRVSLKDPATNQVLWRSTKLEATSGGDKKAVSVTFRASLLKQQNYIAELGGIPAHGAAELVGGYAFRVVLK